MSTRREGCGESGYEYSIIEGEELLDASIYEDIKEAELKGRHIREENRERNKRIEEDKKERIKQEQERKEYERLKEKFE